MPTRRQFDVRWWTWAGFGLSVVLCATAASRSSADEAAEDEQSTGAILKTEYGELEIFPADNPWNLDISSYKVHPRSEEYLASIGLEKPLHPDFGTVWQGAPSGIPYVVVKPGQALVDVKFEYPDESDREKYPIPEDPLIEGGPDASHDSDRHVLLLDFEHQRLFELFHVVREGNRWTAGSGAIFDLGSNKLRPAGWTSADAAGLPIFPGLVRYDEVLEQQEIRHALRFTVRRTQRAYVAPATHFASRSRDSKLPPMGLRVRLKADYAIDDFPAPAQVILRGLKKYGMLLADNGGDWFISGAPDPRWDDDAIHTLKRVRGSDLEAVDTGPLVTE